MKTITVKIGKKGKIAIDVEGVEGEGCEALTQALSSALGVVESVNHKPNYFVELDEMSVNVYEEEG